MMTDTPATTVPDEPCRAGSGKAYYGPGQKASVCRWELTASFLTKEQVQGFLAAYMAENTIPLDFSYHEDGDSPPAHVIQIECNWANNLTQVAKLLERFDHDPYL